MIEAILLGFKYSTSKARPPQMTASASQQRPGPPDSSMDGVSGRFDQEHQVWESGSFTHKTIFFPLKMVIFHMILLDLPSFSIVLFKAHGKFHHELEISPLTACQLLLISSRHSLIRQTYIQNNVCYLYTSYHTT